jgi:hypothetical protein
MIDLSIDIRCDVNVFRLKFSPKINRKIIFLIDFFEFSILLFIPSIINSKVHCFSVFNLVLFHGLKLNTHPLNTAPPGDEKRNSYLQGEN